MKAKNNLRFDEPKKNRRHPLIFATCFLILLVIFYIALILSAEFKNEVSTVEVGSTYQYDKIYLKIGDLEFDISNFFQINSNVNLQEIGDYEVIYTPLFPLGKTYKRTIYVRDTTAPKIVLHPLEKSNLKSINQFSEPGYTVIDNYDGDITNQMSSEITKVAPHKYTVNYSISDSSGNTSTASRELTVFAGWVALTFDDGPSVSITPKILNLLSENDIKATFFVLGFDENKNEIINRMYEEGHTIGYHGYIHTYSEVYKSVDSVMENFYKLEEKVENLTGYSSKLIRFPGGSSNTISIKYSKNVMSDATERATEEGYVYFDWNVDSQDAGGANTADEIYQNVISGLKYGRLNVILMHDASGKDASLEALEYIINYCIENDYEFVPLTANTKPVQHGIQN